MMCYRCKKEIEQNEIWSFKKKRGYYHYECAEIDDERPINITAVNRKKLKDFIKFYYPTPYGWAKEVLEEL